MEIVHVCVHVTLHVALRCSVNTCADLNMLQVRDFPEEEVWFLLL